MNDKEFKEELLGLIQYFKGLEKSGADPSVRECASRASALLEGYPPKIDAGSFGKEEAIDLNGDLTKGISDWKWPSAVRARIQEHIDTLIKFYGPLI